MSASGVPTPTISLTSGTLPTGVTFTDNGNGTATLAGTPATGTAGSYPLTFTASNTVQPDATQNFTLTVVSPTAANAEVSGRVINSADRGLANVRVTISGGSLAQPISTLTNGFGYYTLPEIPVGETYIIEVSSKVYTFSQPTAVYSVSGNLTDVNFIGEGR